MYKETTSKVRVREMMGEIFWTAREVRQGYPLSPLLFSVLATKLQKKQMGKVR